MKTLIIAATCGLALTALTTCFAASAQDTGAAASQGIGQVYGSIGVTGQKAHKTGSNVGGIDARVGTKITPYFGVEGEAAVGTNKDTTSAGDYRLTSKVAAYGVGYLPLSPNFDLLGRVGLSDTDLKAPAVAGKLEQGTAIDYGVGAQYHLNSDYAFRADLTKSDFQNHKGSTNATTISLIRKF